MSLETPSITVAPPPAPHPEHGPLIVAVATCLAGVALLALVLTGGWRTLEPAALPAPPPIVVLASTPTAGPHPAGGATAATTPANPAGAIVAQPSGAEQSLVASPFARGSSIHVPASWESRFYPLYERAAATFGVNWLLIASIHKQETDFSTAPSTYHGLNFAHCCGGPMQFNVTNGPVTTWQLVSRAYRFAPRPQGYDHETAAHPSIYDDYDAIMAAAWLLYSDGANTALDDSAWQAAYDYYGHDADGVTYADQVLARAIGWSQHGFCINCGLDQGLVYAVYAAYGAPVLAALQQAQAQAAAAAAPAARRHARRTAAGRVAPLTGCDRSTRSTGCRTPCGVTARAQATAASASRSSSPAMRSVASSVPPSRRRDSWARRKYSGASCSQVAPMPPCTEIISRAA